MPRSLFVLSSGGLTRPPIKRILLLSGYDVRLGVPGDDDLVGVWGNNPLSINGEVVPTDRKSGMVRVEDAWLRSLFPGRSATAPVGLLIDETGAHYDATQPSDLETVLVTHPLDDTALLDRARGSIERLKEAHLTKYSAVDPQVAAPDPGYVLVIDQTEGDASVHACGADRNRFLEMLFVAQEEHPGAPILIKCHPETSQGFRGGYFSDADTNDRITLHTDAISPWPLLEGAIAVYTVSSQLGFEAIYAGHKPRVFGAPFYAGWGLTEDEFPVQRRQRRLSRAQLFAAAILIYPKWYDPFTDMLCSFETALENLAAETRAWRADRLGWVASRMTPEMQTNVQSVFGRFAPVQFEDAPAVARNSGKPWMVWSENATLGHRDAFGLAPGILQGLLPDKTTDAPLSLAIEELGTHGDLTKPNRLEALISARATLRPDQRRRAEALIRAINAATNNNVDPAAASIALPERHCILVAGVAQAGTKDQDNVSLSDAALLRATREHNPDACLIYCPGSDTRNDTDTSMEKHADLVAQIGDRAYLLGNVSEVWTTTSILGFEALIRNLPVTTLGVPFYAGWTLTRDLAEIPPRRRAEPDLAGLVHACLIDYPRYYHPDLQRPCPVETALSWLTQLERDPALSWHGRFLAKLQKIASRSNADK
ncbi:MAG: capsular polysaccharide biosynthesis protein [Roseobacter sp.]